MPELSDLGGVKFKRPIFYFAILMLGSPFSAKSVADQCTLSQS